MSRGTTLKLYKKFNLKMDDETFKRIVQKYAKHNQKSVFSDNKKTLEEYAKDIPLIMDINPFREYSVYDEKTGTWKSNRPENTIKNLKNEIIGNVDSRDRMYCEHLMDWDFCSSFDCLIDYFRLNCCNFRNSMVEITPQMALQMLKSIEYILGGHWDDNTERIMDNPFIRIFTDGYNADSYWKYVYRDKTSNKKKINIKKYGFDITINCPKSDVKQQTMEYDDSMRESDEYIEYALGNFRNGLLAFLKSDLWARTDDEGDDGWLGYDKRYKYILAYEYWG